MKTAGNKQNKITYFAEIHEYSTGGSSGIVGNVGETIGARTGGTEFILCSIVLNPDLGGEDVNEFVGLGEGEVGIGVGVVDVDVDVDRELLESKGAETVELE
eukprot:CAMPEP_0174826152 /NCGR_PEP_ID=MMETSP1107-20130205/43587_1 /TAXON_ID=36770 /ORGANISM="Paraphysomonas vestita, Strain GFlagA" /LENGTH=101 /DNA_ID=CAMNT_0016058705 /DNA_START=137 /DNA_END=442 /DNA_ORIENTATION=+